MELSTAALVLGRDSRLLILKGADRVWSYQGSITELTELTEGCCQRPLDRACPSPSQRHACSLASWALSCTVLTNAIGAGAVEMSEDDDADFTAQRPIMTPRKGLGQRPRIPPAQVLEDSNSKEEHSSLDDFQPRRPLHKRTQSKKDRPLPLHPSPALAGPVLLRNR